MNDAAKSQEAEFRLLLEQAVSNGRSSTWMAMSMAETWSNGSRRGARGSGRRFSDTRDWMEVDHRPID